MKLDWRRFADLFSWSREYLGSPSPDLDARLRSELAGVEVFEAAVRDVPTDDASWDLAMAALCEATQRLLQPFHGRAVAVFVEHQQRPPSRLRSHRRLVSQLGLNPHSHVEREVGTDSGSYFVAIVSVDADRWTETCAVMQRNQPSYMVLSGRADASQLITDTGLDLIVSTIETKGAAINMYDFRVIPALCDAGFVVGRFVFDSRYDAAALALFAKGEMKRRVETLASFRQMPSADMHGQGRGTGSE